MSGKSPKSQALKNKIKPNAKPTDSAAIRAMIALNDNKKEEKPTNSTNKSTKFVKGRKKVGINIEEDNREYIESNFGPRGYTKVVNAAVRLLRQLEHEEAKKGKGETS